jgi:hypothetical protein
MEYLIPRGTPVQIRQYGQVLCPHTTKRDLSFSQPVVSTTDELIFHDGYWRIVVAKALVVEPPRSESSPDLN